MLANHTSRHKPILIYEKMYAFFQTIKCLMVMECDTQCAPQHQPSHQLAELADLSSHCATTRHELIEKQHAVTLCKKGLQANY